MIVFVINKNGEALMPCSNRKARLLLKNKKVKIVNYKPFTVQLLYGSRGHKQETNLGIDVGSKHIGISITSDTSVLAKGQIDLRQDVSGLLKTRSKLRRNRRNRKTRYRRCKNKIHTKRFFKASKRTKKSKWTKIKRGGSFTSSRPDGWLPPSVQSRIDNTCNWINKFYKLLPKCVLHIEVGKFDIQKIENPDIQGTDYQQGTMYGYRNRIAYLIAREKGKCQFCNQPYKKGDGWRLHHIWGKLKDRPKDWALVHESCHKELHAKGLEEILRSKRSKSLKGATYMNIIRKRLFSAFPIAKFTYGNITFQDRCDLNLDKTHYNDAIAITGIKDIKSNEDSIFYIKQFRKKKRSLHEATARKGRTAKNITSKRNSKNTKEQSGIFLNDSVRVLGKMGFISGFTNGCCYVKDIFDEYITIPGKSYKQIDTSLIEVVSHNNNWQFIPHLKERDFLPEQG